MPKVSSCCLAKLKKESLIDKAKLCLGIIKYIKPRCSNCGHFCLILEIPIELVRKKE